MQGVGKGEVQTPGHQGKLSVEKEIKEETDELCKWCKVSI